MLMDDNIILTSRSRQTGKLEVTGVQSCARPITGTRRGGTGGGEAGRDGTKTFLHPGSTSPSLT